MGAVAAALLLLATPGTGAANGEPTCNSRPVTIFGTPGNDPITGTPGADVIWADAGNDTVTALGGNDIVCLGPGDDSVDGGAGNDLFLADAGPDGADTYVGGAGRDVANYRDRTVGLELTLNEVADDGATGEGDNLDLTVENLNGGEAADIIVGSRFDNELIGGLHGNNRILGAGGNDTLRGGHDSDTLAGGPGDDFMFGGGGDDIAFAAAGPDGADYYEGDTGVDTVSYTARTSAVRVSIDEVADDGEPGEGDLNHLEVEKVVGGNGNDTLSAVVCCGDRTTHDLDGGFGNDILDTRSPVGDPDVANGNVGIDMCRTNGTDIRMSCEL